VVGCEMEGTDNLFTTPRQGHIFNLVEGGLVSQFYSPGAVLSGKP
jgi:hypothetical protein